MDYYQLLEVSPKDSIDVIRKSYQRLLLKYHPDKSTNSSNEKTNGSEQLSDSTTLTNSSSQNEKFLQIQKAWDTLRSPETRAVYDAKLTNANLSAPAAINEILSLDELDYDEENDIYSYPCRCSGYYYVDKNEIQAHGSVFSCSDCSLSIQVHLNSS